MSKRKKSKEEKNVEDEEIEVEIEFIAPKEQDEIVDPFFLKEKEIPVFEKATDENIEALNEDLEKIDDKIDRFKQDNSDYYLNQRTDEWPYKIENMCLEYHPEWEYLVKLPPMNFYEPEEWYDDFAFAFQPVVRKRKTNQYKWWEILENFRRNEMNDCPRNKKWMQILKDEEKMYKQRGKISNQLSSLKAMKILIDQPLKQFVTLYESLAKGNKLETFLKFRFKKERNVEKRNQKATSLQLSYSF
jgi:hypothetical protein